VENAEKRLMKWIEENGWEVLNGNKQGDEEGEWTHITVIDYGIVNEEAWEGVEEFTIGKRALRKRRDGKNREGKEGVGDRNKTFFFFLELLFFV
jgi:hypothetical protein